MAQARRRIERPEKKPGKTAREAPRLEELRETAVGIVHRTIDQSVPFTQPDLVAEAERVRSLYAPLFADLAQRAQAAESLEELDALMERQARLAHLLQEEMTWIGGRQPEE